MALTLGGLRPACLTRSRLLVTHSLHNPGQVHPLVATTDSHVEASASLAQHKAVKRLRRQSQAMRLEQQRHRFGREHVGQPAPTLHTAPTLETQPSKTGMSEHESLSLFFLHTAARRRLCHLAGELIQASRVTSSSGGGSNSSSSSMLNHAADDNSVEAHHRPDDDFGKRHISKSMYDGVDQSSWYLPHSLSELGKEVQRAAVLSMEKCKYYDFYCSNFRLVYSEDP